MTEDEKKRRRDVINNVRVEILLLNSTFPQMFARYERRTLITNCLLFLIRQRQRPNHKNIHCLSTVLFQLTVTKNKAMVNYK